MILISISFGIFFLLFLVIVAGILTAKHIKVVLAFIAVIVTFFWFVGHFHADKTLVVEETAASPTTASVAAPLAPQAHTKAKIWISPQ
jgi:hypothetical protein